MTYANVFARLLIVYLKRIYIAIKTILLHSHFTLFDAQEFQFILHRFSLLPLMVCFTHTLSTENGNGIFQEIDETVN